MSASRYPRLVVSIRLADTRKGPDGRARWTPGTDEEIGKVGGCWDTRRKRWVRGAKARGMLVLRFHRGQEDAARWFAEWMRRFASGDWAGVERMWSVMLVGARRSGKTHIACAVMIAFAVLAPASRLWAVSPTLETGDELDAAFRELLPRRWYVRRQAKTGRATTYRLSNGSTINLRSAVKPERLKAGRVDMALINEAQEIDELAYLKLRPATADRGGLVLLTCNPPDRPVGRWIEKHYFKAIAGELDGKAFVLDPRRNPGVNYEALSSMAKESDEKTYARDILGLFAPVGDQVFHAWSDVENWKDPPPDLVDITAMVARRELGAAAGYLVGEDFQRVPSMVACVHRVFLDPKTGLELLWVVDEVIADESDENDLCDGLEGLPRWRPGDGTPSKRDHGEGYRGWKLPEDRNDAPGHCAVIMDASGFFQDGDHKQNRSSEKWLRARQWTSLYKPQKDSDRNPAIIERMRTGNALLKSAGDVRRLFVARHCVRTAEAFRNYENKNGSPNRRSAFAHVIDAVTYVAYRLYGRPLIKARVEYFGAKRFTRGEMFAR